MWSTTTASFLRGAQFRHNQFAFFRLARFGRVALVHRCSIAKAAFEGSFTAGGPPYFAFGLMTLLPQPIERHDG